MKNYYLLLCFVIATIGGGSLQAQSCIKLFGNTDISATEIQQMRVDSLSGALDFLNSTTSTNPISINNGSMTIDADQQQIFLVLATQLAFSTSYTLRIITAQEGNLIASFPLANPVIELQYDCVANRLYGLEILGVVPAATVRLVSIDPTNGAVSPIGGTLLSLGGEEAIVNGSSTINPNNGRYYFVAIDDVSQTTIHDVALASGVQTTGMTTPLQAVSLEANKTDNRVFALYRQSPSTVGLAEYTAGSGLTSLGTFAGFVGTPLSQSALDPYGNRFLFISNNAGVQTLHSANTTTATLTDNVALASPISNLSAAVPCSAFADFELANACVGAAVNFTDLSVGAEAWSWNFGDPASGAANTSSLANPTHTYNSAGTFDVSLSIDGCVGTQSTTQQITISTPPTPTLPDSIVSCSPSVVLDPGAIVGASYFWISGSSNQTITISNPNPNWYWVDVTVGSCTVRDSVFVNLSGGGAAQIWTNNNQSFCGTNQATLNTNGVVGSAYSWSTGATTPSITVNASGTYSITVTTPNCVIIDQLQVDIVPPFNLASGGTVTGCSGTQVLDATVAGASYLWSTGASSATINITQSGTYTVTVTKSGCEEVAISQVNIVSLSAVFDQANQTICDNTTNINLQPTVVYNGGIGAPAYQWSTGDLTASIEVANGNSGTYTVTVSGNSCSTQATATLQFTPSLLVELGNPQNICNGDTALLDAGNVAGATYAWSNGASTQQIAATQSGTYTVTVSSAGCTATDDIVVSVQTPPAIDFGITDSTICSLNNESILLDAGVGQSYSWSPISQNTPTITVHAAGTYAVTVTDAAGCTATKSIIIGERCESVLIFPNAFSPNNDTHNDAFRPVWQFVTNYRLRVFNRWGELVYESTNIDEGWDGTTLQSKKQEIGVYVWMAEYTDNLGNEFKQQGSVCLVR